ncbi:MAG TPA: MbnH family di-heme enzyme [Candidatus Binatia bacterium]|nr:MbnH family di-heme enzyme [Candidatus Binatia bacterium]
MKRTSRTSLGFILALFLALVSLARPATATFQWGIPDWIPPPAEPPNNRITPAKVELGRHLFYDKRLSANQKMACATCHEQARAFSDGKRNPVGITGQVSKRNTMALTNVAYYPTLTWGNPQIESLEDQAMIPLFGEHPVEMGMAGKEALLLTRLQSEPVYQQLFVKAFPEQAAKNSQADLFSLSTITKAVASFQRTLLSFNSPYDRYRYGEQKSAISPAAQRGEALFLSGRMDCYKCHGSVYFTDNVRHARIGAPEQAFHNTGLYNEDGKGSYPAGHAGVAEITGRDDDMGKFRTPSLRNVALTAPYMHDGSITTLEEVIHTHYAKKGRAVHAGKRANPLRSRLLDGFEASDREVRDLVEFLKSLTDETFVTNPKFSDPWRQ